jgi:hypothetical protein
MKDDTDWLQTKDVPPNHRHHCSKSQQQCHPRARAMNPQGRFQSVIGFPNQSSLKLSQVSRHPQQSKYPTLFYPACATRENGPPPFSATQSLRQSFSFLPGLPAQLVQNLNAGTLRTHSCEKNRAQANAFQTCRPQVMAGSHQRPLQPTIPWLILQQLHFLSFANQDAGEDGSMNGSGSAWECM